jgi:hypothetical protein
MANYYGNLQNAIYIHDDDYDYIQIIKCTYKPASNSTYSTDQSSVIVQCESTDCTYFVYVHDYRFTGSGVSTGLYVCNVRA